MSNNHLKDLEELSRLASEATPGQPDRGGAMKWLIWRIRYALAMYRALTKGAAGVAWTAAKHSGEQFDEGHLSPEDAAYEEASYMHEG